MESTEELERLPKLVRNYIPDVIRTNEGREPVTDTITDDAEYDRALRRKVREEAAELCDASTPENLTEEMADILEVLAALMELHGISDEVVRKAKETKLTKRGGFDGRVRLLQ